MSGSVKLVVCDQIFPLGSEGGSEWVSEWVSESKWAIFQLYHSENKLHFDEMMTMISALHYNTNTLSLIFIVLAHWNNSSRVSLHSDTLVPLGHIILIPSQLVFALTP
jgi:hypothetical protein